MISKKQIDELALLQKESNVQKLALLSEQYIAQFEGITQELLTRDEVTQLHKLYQYALFAYGQLKQEDKVTQLERARRLLTEEHFTFSKNALTTDAENTFVDYQLVIEDFKKSLTLYRKSRSFQLMFTESYERETQQNLNKLLALLDAQNGNLSSVLPPIRSLRLYQSHKPLIDHIINSDLDKERQLEKNFKLGLIPVNSTRLMTDSIAAVELYDVKPSAIHDSELMALCLASRFAYSAEVVKRIEQDISSLNRSELQFDCCMKPWGMFRPSVLVLYRGAADSEALTALQKQIVEHLVPYLTDRCIENLKKHPAFTNWHPQKPVRNETPVGHRGPQ